MADMGFGDRVLQARLNLAARRRKTVSQVEVGEAVGVSGVAIGSWESGEKEPDSLSKIARLAAFLEVTPCWLAFGNDRGLLDGPADSVAPVPREPKPVVEGGIKGVKHHPKKPRGLGGRGRR